MNIIVSKIIDDLIILILQVSYTDSFSVTITVPILHTNDKGS